MDFMTFGSLAKMVRSKSVFINNNTNLCEYLKIRPEDFVENVPECLSEKEFSCLIQKNMPLPALRYNISGQQRKEEEQVAEEEFQKSIKSMIMKPG